MSKVFLFSTYTKFADAKLTGAHRRFLELIKHLAKDNQVILVSPSVPQLGDIANIRYYTVESKQRKWLPCHLNGALNVYVALRKNKTSIYCDYACSFNPVISICYGLVGIGHIVSLFREDLIGYQRAVNASKLKIHYFQLQERVAVRNSEKIIVQCENDRKNLIKRNTTTCKNVEQKTFVQINNANASWMNSHVVCKNKGSCNPIVLFIGNFDDSRKGHSVLLPVAARLIKEGICFELMIAGDGKELESFKSRYERYQGIHFLGRVDNMASYLCQSDFEVVPSLIDSCPNTVLEGLNAGVAVYGANTGGIPDLLQDKRYLFEPNEDSLYNLLKEVLITKRYIEDAEKQRKRKEALTFEWGEKIQQIIEVNCS